MIAGREAALKALVTEPHVVRLLRALDGGGETRIVGGAVRDALLGLPLGDIDLATALPPDEVIRRARHAGLKPVPTGIEHGTVTVVVSGRPFEVTTLREDIETDGRRATVRFGADFDADARRRDFTINAMSLDAEGRLHDPVGGLADLEARRVRFIGDAATRIREDYLRTLRFFRFHARFGSGAPDPQGLYAALSERAGLRGLSRERIRAELLKMLVAEGAADTIAVFLGTGLFGIVTGGVGDQGRLRRAIAHHGDAPDSLLRLGALCLFHPGDADRLRERLRLSNSEHAYLSGLGRLLTHLHGARAPLDRTAILRLALDHGAALIGQALAILAGEPCPVLTPDARALADDLASGAMALPGLPVTGAHIVAQGVPKGPGVGATLAHVRNLWIESACPMEADTLAALVRKAVDDWQMGRLATDTSPR